MGPVIPPVTKIQAWINSVDLVLRKNYLFFIEMLITILDDRINEKMCCNIFCTRNLAI